MKQIEDAHAFSYPLICLICWESYFMVKV